MYAHCCRHLQFRLRLCGRARGTNGLGCGVGLKKKKKKTMTVGAERPRAPPISSANWPPFVGCRAPGKSLRHRRRCRCGRCLARACALPDARRRPPAAITCEKAKKSRDVSDRNDLKTNVAVVRKERGNYAWSGRWTRLIAKTKACKY